MSASKSSPSRGQSRSLHRPDSSERATQDPAPGLRKPTKDAAAVAEYIALMTAELAAIAGSAKLDMLTYFLNMARLEAEFHMRRRE